jgi:hypothetical protein
MSAMTNPLTSLGQCTRLQAAGITRRLQGYAWRRVEPRA